MHSEASSLPHDSIEEHGGLLCKFIIFYEKLLKLVDHDKDARHRTIRIATDPASHVLNPSISEHLSTFLHDAIQVFERAQTELALAFDPDDIGMRNLAFGIYLEFDPFLEVEKYQSKLIRAIFDRSAGNHRMQQRRLP